MKKYVLTDEQVNNCIVFLNRVKFKGIEEANAVLEIIQALHNPVEEVQENDCTR